MILTPDAVRTETVGGVTITIREKIIPDSARSAKDQASWCRKGDPVKPCRPIGRSGIPMGVCIHNTGDIATPAATNPAEQYTRATWPNCNMGGAAVHFFVYDGEIWQNLRESEQGWHSGDGSFRRAVKENGPVICGNLDTVAIECIGNRAGSEETTARLAAYLLKKYGLDPATSLYAHHDFANKYCPAYILPHWQAFYDRVTALLGEVAAPSGATPFAPRVGETVRFLGGKHYVSANAKTASGGERRACTAKLTQIAPGGAHPYHVIACDGSRAVYGWVDAGLVAPVEKDKAAPFEPKAGTEVRFLGGRHYASSAAANPVGGERRACRAMLTRVVPGAPHPYHLIASDGSAAVYGWVDEVLVAPL